MSEIIKRLVIFSIKGIETGTIEEFEVSEDVFIEKFFNLDDKRVYGWNIIKNMYDVIVGEPKLPMVGFFNTDISKREYKKQKVKRWKFKVDAVNKDGSCVVRSTSLNSKEEAYELFYAWENGGPKPSVSTELTPADPGLSKIYIYEGRGRVSLSEIVAGSQPVPYSIDGQPPLEAEASDSRTLPHVEVAKNREQFEIVCVFANFEDVVFYESVIKVSEGFSFNEYEDAAAWAANFATLNKLEFKASK